MNDAVTILFHASFTGSFRQYTGVWNREDIHRVRRDPELARIVREYHDGWDTRDDDLDGLRLAFNARLTALVPGRDAVDANPLNFDTASVPAGVRFALFVTEWGERLIAESDLNETA